jgi:hypothetical protein
MKKPKVRWTSDERSALIKRLVELREENPIIHVFSLMEKAQEVLPQHRRRKIQGVSQITDLARVFETAWIDHVTAPIPPPVVVEVERVVQPVKPFISEYTVEQLVAELGARMSSMSKNMELLMKAHAQAAHPTLHESAAMHAEFPESDPPAPPEAPAVRVGLLGFLPGQVDHLSRKTEQHAGRREFRLPNKTGFGGTIDAVICFNNKRSHSTEKLFEALKGRIPLGRATGLGDAVRMVQNLSVGLPIDA